jgi:hypothetical protein
MHETVNENLKQLFYTNKNIANSIKDIEQQVIENKINPFSAAKILLRKYENK